MKFMNGFMTIALWSGLAATVFGQVPEQNRFTKKVLAEKLDEPLEMVVLPDERVLFIERKGNLRLFDPAGGQAPVIARIPVSTKYTSASGVVSEAEDGLLGLGIDPGFSTNHWIYLYYSPEGPEAKNILVRYELKGSELNVSSAKILLEVPTQREECCHTGGSIDWDRHGNLYLSTGDNTSSRASDGYNPIDERPGRSTNDAQKSSSNTNDLRGKILRIHPEADGTYTIPEGNLFPKGTPGTRPEIYTMGLRNPYRISVDRKTGFLYWGDVGPDAGSASADRGPAAEDEINQARGPGFFGWPYFVGNNKAYRDYDFAASKPGKRFDPAKPLNDSPHNTGLKDLPPAQGAFLWYPAAESRTFPLLGSGGRSAMAGPVFYSGDFKKAARAFPDYYDGKLFIYEWMRDWIIVVSMNEDGDYLQMERFAPGIHLDHPIDMAFGPNGDLYVLEYGTGWFMKNDDSRLVRIEYNGGNRPPVVKAAAGRVSGALPLEVRLSAEGTQDFDGDELSYSWEIKAAKQSGVVKLKGPEQTHVFRKAGLYEVTLYVTDSHGNTASERLTISAGNEPPQVDIQIVKGNTTFFFPEEQITYSVKVKDKEDGSLDNGRILAKNVNVSAAFQDSGSEEEGEGTSMVTFLAGKKLIEGSDCKACHFEDKKSIGPSFQEVAMKYKGDGEVVRKLSEKIIKGGGGVWGEVAMSPHPSVGLPEAGQMVNYIMSLGKGSKPVALPVKGVLTTRLPEGISKQKAVYKLQASYTDRGGSGLLPQSAGKTHVLKSPVLEMGYADSLSPKIMKFRMSNDAAPLAIVMDDKSILMFRKIDLSGVKALEFLIAAPKEQLNAVGGVIEVRLDSPEGPVLARTPAVQPDASGISATSPPSPLKVSVSPASGLHDLYFVCLSNHPESKQPLFVPLSVEFLTR